MSILGPQRFENDEAASTVHVEIGQGIVDALNGTRSRGQVEHNLLSTHQSAHRLEIADVRFDDRRSGGFELGRFRSVGGAARRGHRQPRTHAEKAAAQIHADEAEAA
jgi:hypothetical protein